MKEFYEASQVKERVFTYYKTTDIQILLGATALCSAMNAKFTQTCSQQGQAQKLRVGRGDP